MSGKSDGPRCDLFLKHWLTGLSRVTSLPIFYVIVLVFPSALRTMLSRISHMRWCGGNNMNSISRWRLSLVR